MDSFFRKNIASLLLAMFLVLTLNFKALAQAEIQLKKIGELENVVLEPDYNYFGFNIGSDALIWFEGYTATLFIYDLTLNELNSIVLEKGKGPHEFQTIPGFFVSNDDVIYLIDYGNAKYIKLNQAGEFLDDEVPEPGLLPSDMAGDANWKVIRDDTNQNALFYLYEPESKTYTPLDVTSPDTPDDFFRDLYKRTGTFTVQHQTLIHAPRYYPYLYVYDLEARKLSKVVQFDESDVVESEPLAVEGGGRMTFPPEHVDIIIRQIVAVQGSPGRIWMLAEGESRNREYGMNRLMEYDFHSEEFVAEHELSVQVSTITVSEDKLFIYSEEEYKIYEYKIMDSK